MKVRMSQHHSNRIYQLISLYLTLPFKLKKLDILVIIIIATVYLEEKQTYLECVHKY